MVLMPLLSRLLTLLVILTMPLFLARLTLIPIKAARSEERFSRNAETEIYTLSLHDALPILKDGVNATPLPTVNTTGYIDHAAFLGTINPDTNKSGMEIGRAVQQECRDRSRMPSSA